MKNDDIVLSINSGSSSIKFSAFSLGEGNTQLIAHGRAASLNTVLNLECSYMAEAKQTLVLSVGDHPVGEAIKQFSAWLRQSLLRQNQISDIKIIAHRVVHGGDIVQHSIIDAELLEKLQSMVPLDPLHLPANIESIKTALTLFPNAFHVACFDTVFHSNIPLVAKQYALPKSLFDQGVKRYGFHGLSYHYVCLQLHAHYNDFSHKKFIIVHLGSGASLCAIKNGVSQYCTMGFSVLDGVTMGSRCGGLDPGILLYLLRLDYSADDIEQLLYKKSGLLGLSGKTSDLRILLDDDSDQSRQAVEHFIFTVVREIGALVAILNGCDALVFTGGIGENSAVVRRSICDKLSYLGISINDLNNRNSNSDRIISDDHCKRDVWVIPTNEEMVMAQAALYLTAND